MIQVATDWNPRQTRLRTLVKDRAAFDEAIDLCLEMHGMVHFSEATKQAEAAFADQIWDGLIEDDFAVIPRGSEFSIAWYFWHIARIEDLTVNILIARSKQVLDAKWSRKLKTSVRDTGNAMNDDETVALSRALDKAALRNYRTAVGMQTRAVLRSLAPEDMKRKVQPSDLARILDEGGVLEDANSKWLLEFWGNKDVAGLLLMPVTRHQIVHLNDCVKIRRKIGKPL